jgi:hypothetical protein
MKSLVPRQGIWLVDWAHRITILTHHPPSTIRLLLHINLFFWGLLCPPPTQWQLGTVAFSCVVWMSYSELVFRVFDMDWCIFGV